MSDWSDPAYADFEKEANKDTRVGDHDFVVSDVVSDTWPSGDPRVKIRGILATANNAKADLTLSPPPPPEVLKVEKAGYTAGKKKAIAASIAMHRNLAEFYGKTPEQIVQGDLFRVKTAMSKRNPDGTGGFIRVVAFLDPKKVSAESKEKAKEIGSVPF